MRRRLGSATLSQLAFPRGKQPGFPRGEIQLGQYSCKKIKSENKIIIKVSNSDPCVGYMIHTCSINVSQMLSGTENKVLTHDCMTSLNW